jgi:hypothetical protein
LDTPTQVSKGFVYKGSSDAGNSDIVIYDDAYNYIASTGTIAHSGGASAPQFATLSVALPPGRYYCGASNNATTTGRFFRWSASAASLMMLGMFKSNATDTPPIAASAITPADYTNTAVPLVGLICRTVFRSVGRDGWPL